jgi:TrwC relaxase
MTKIVDAIVRYLTPRTLEPTAPGGPGPGRGEAGPARYYADPGEELGPWRGPGAQAVGLAGQVTEADLAKVLAGRDPATGARLVSAQGSAGRRPKLGVGAETRRSAAGLALYDPTDAAAVLGLSATQIRAMLDVGTTLALSRLIPAPGGLPAQPEGSYLAPIIDAAGDRWVTETELSRCEAVLQAGTGPGEVDALGPPDELLPIGEAARLAGVTPRVSAQARPAPRDQDGERRSDRRGTSTAPGVPGRPPWCGRALARVARRTRRLPRAAATASGTGGL